MRLTQGHISVHVCAPVGHGLIFVCSLCEAAATEVITLHDVLKSKEQGIVRYGM